MTYIGGSIILGLHARPPPRPLLPSPTRVMLGFLHRLWRRPLLLLLQERVVHRRDGRRRRRHDARCSPRRRVSVFGPRGGLEQDAVIVVLGAEDDGEVGHVWGSSSEAGRLLEGRAGRGTIALWSVPGGAREIERRLEVPAWLAGRQQRLCGVLVFGYVPRG